MKDVKFTYRYCCIYCDKGYLGADVRLDLFETVHIRLECPYRFNRKDWKPTFVPFAKARKRIETVFSQLVGQFITIRNYAKITGGLFARIIPNRSLENFAFILSENTRYIAIIMSEVIYFLQ